MLTLAALEFEICLVGSRRQVSKVKWRYPTLLLARDGYIYTGGCCYRHTSPPENLPITIVNSYYSSTILSGGVEKYPSEPYHQPRLPCTFSATKKKMEQSHEMSHHSEKARVEVDAAQPPSASLRLLAIPREIRDNIYAHCIPSVPVNVQEIGQRGAFDGESLD